MGWCATTSPVRGSSDANRRCSPSADSALSEAVCVMGPSRYSPVTTTLTRTPPSFSPRLAPSGGGESGEHCLREGLGRLTAVEILLLRGRHGELGDLTCVAGVLRPHHDEIAGRERAVLERLVALDAAEVHLDGLAVELAVLRDARRPELELHLR